MEGGDGWTFIDDEFSRDLDNILEEDDDEGAGSGAETGYVSGDRGDEDELATMRSASLQKRNKLRRSVPDASEQHQAATEGNLPDCLLQLLLFKDVIETSIW